MAISFFVYNRITILHQNISGLIGKSDVFLVCLNDLEENGRRVDILCFTEHNMTSNDTSFLKLPNYKLATYYARNNRKGGSCILVGNNLQYKIVDLSKYSISNIIECCAIELTEHKMIIVCIYRVPQQEKVAMYYRLFLSTFNDILHDLLSTNKKISICGDFNINILKKCKYSIEFEHLISSFNLKFATREVTRPTSGTCLDNIIHNIRGAKSDICELAISDHKAQLLDCPVRKTCSFDHWFSKKRDYSKDNLVKFRECLCKLTFKEMYEITDANMAFDNFFDLFKLFYDLCFPTIRVKNTSKARPRWLSQGIRRGCKHKRALLWKYRLSKDPHDRKLFKTYSGRFRKIVNLTQKSQNNDYIFKSTNKSKATWNIIHNNKQRLPRENIIQLEYNGEIVKKPENIANIFNNYFIDSVENQCINNMNYKSTCVYKSPKSFYMNPISPIQVANIIGNLKNTNSTGYDDVSTRTIKYVHDIISPILSHIINLCIEQGIFPCKLKTTIIKPLYKKDEKHDIKNYRPIALITIFSKIFEKVIFDNMYSYFESHNILTKEQKGFRKNKTIDAAIYEFLNMVYPRMDKRQTVFTLYMDMTKAFDYVEHNKLLHKLETYGIRGNILNLLKSYLSHRIQITKINRICPKTRTDIEYISTPRIVSHGVPQGSVLGPLLFLVYINDIPKSTTNPMILFADDCTVLYNDRIDINNSLRSIIQWLQNNNLQINLNKTKVMDFRQSASNVMHTNIVYEGNVLEETKTTKFLGLHIDNNMKWQAHLEFVCNKLSQSAYALYLLSKKVSQQAVLVAYHSYVASRMRYGIIFWGNATNNERVLIAQKRCIRAIRGLKRMDSCKPHFKELRILTFPSLYIYEVALFVKRHPQLFPKVLRARRSDQVCSRAGKTALFNKSILAMAPKIYNKIPKPIRECQDIIIFRRLLFNHLTEKSYYSIREFLET